MFKAILIDVVEKSVEEVEIDNYREITSHLDCDMFTVGKVDMNTDVYVDDEGLIKEGYIDDEGYRHNLSGFRFSNTQIFMGNGLVVGRPDFEGETTDCPYTKQEIEQMVLFIDYDRNEEKPQAHIQVLPFPF